MKLGIVISSRAQAVDQADALRHVAGYYLANDISERKYQIRRGGGHWPLALRRLACLGAGSGRRTGGPGAQSR